MKTIKIVLVLFSVVALSSCGSLRKSDCGLGKLDTQTENQQNMRINEANS